MPSPKQFKTVGDAQARSVAGPTAAFADDDVASTVLYVDLSAYDNGRYIEIEVTEDFYVCFVPDTSTTPTRTAAALSGGKIDETAYRYRLVTASQPYHCVVPHGNSILAYRTVGAGGTGFIAVRRA